MDFSTIQNIDFQVLQWFNGSNNVILDQLALVLTSGFTWIPLYVVLFIVVMRNNETMMQIGLVVGPPCSASSLPTDFPMASSSPWQKDGDHPTTRW